MAIINRIGDFQDEMTAWRRDLHAHPELGFEEVRTSALVADKLRAFGLDEVHTGIATTGVVGVLRAGSGGHAIGLRADMDAATTGTPQCCSAPPVISPRPATSTARSTSSFSPPRRCRPAAG
jgi:hippurate hydrolase